jgi:maleate isomerase
MYGWRGRIAAIVGKRNAVCEPELNRIVPAGVSVHAARTSSYTQAAQDKSRTSQIEEVAIYNDPQVMELVMSSAGRLATDLSGLQPNVVVFTHNVASMASVEFNEKLTEVMAGQAGCHALTTGLAVVQALKAVGARKIGLADPFPKPYLTNIVREYLEHPQVGFKVVKEATARGDNPHFITNMSPLVAYQTGRQANHPDADAILLAANVWRTLEIIEPLEQDLGKPVIAANQATAWAALKIMGVASERQYGSLFYQG